MASEMIVYSGTTIENYRVCAIVNNDGKIMFDKSREPNHADPRFYFDERFFTAAIFGCYCAGRMIPEHTPLIMKGRVPTDLGYGSLDVGTQIAVDAVFIPKPEIDWHELSATYNKNLEDHFQEKSPIEILSK